MDRSVVLAALVALLIYPVILVIQAWMRRRKFIELVERLPGPKAKPLVGNTMDFRVPREEVFKVFAKRIKENGPLFRVWAGPIPVVIIRKAEYLETIMSSSKYIDKSYGYKFLHPWLGLGLLTSSGSKWLNRRKVLTPAFHFGTLEGFFDNIQVQARILVKLLKKHAVDGEEFNVYPYITRAALDIICETAMGVSVGAQEDENNSYVRAISDVATLLTRRFLSPWLFPDFSFKISSQGQQFFKQLQVLHGFTHKVIAERKESRKNAGTQVETEDIPGVKKRRPFLDLLLDLQEQGGGLTDQDLREEVDTFMFEGHDTTTSGICWTLHVLGLHPDVQKKVHEELDEVLGPVTDELITTRELSQLRYLEMVIKESMRLYPPVPGISREITEDVKVGEHLIPAGCMIQMSLFYLHRDPDHFPDPLKFDPDRFTPEASRGRHPYAYAPFSAGPRNCIGQKFALMEEKAVLATVLREYVVTTLKPQETLCAELILRPPDGMRIKLQQRHTER
ncbi:cytochrome P450 4C1-like [Ctenocephalides felis]|uniref:cytochrome P450 4C1-like n=1 Tax=Ctenocephalides felis TaxID=7515 RepID=UPI000E6E1156|nr:cytochrome P450 4C1-like [Ctenocephalides felis]